MEQIEKLKLRLGVTETTQDTLLQDILDDAEEEVLAFTNRSELTTGMKSLCIKIAIIQYNKQGSEGMSSDGQGGKSQSWVDGFPNDIQDALVGFRRLKVSNYASKKS